MHTKKLLFVLAAGTTMLFSSCSKDDTTTPDNGNTTQNPSVTSSQICDGVSTSTSYLPLKIGNSWTRNGDFGSGSETKTVTKDTVINGKTYFVVAYKDAMTGNTHEDYFRRDSDGDVYEFIDYDNGGEASPYTKEYLVIPNDAVEMVGYNWEFPPAIIYQGKMNKRIISSNSGSVKTSKCEYNDLIVVKEFDSEGKQVATYYYKKALGLVRESVFGNQDLLAVDLK